MMNVLFVAAEAAPFAKVGGMADVVGSLPGALKKLGVDARVLLPMYGYINHERYNIQYRFSFTFPRRNGLAECHIFSTEYNGVSYYFVKSWPFFGEEGEVYTEWSWDMPRFILFNQVAQAAAWEISQRDNWFPDVVHANDWHTGLVPFLIDYARFGDPNWAHTGTVISIHNMAYQGPYGGGWMWNVGIPGRNHPDLVYNNLTDNMLAIGIAYSDKVSTVSPRYATEIQYAYAGYGLEGLIRRRLPDLVGILNGIDQEEWNPETDKRIVSHFNAENFIEKRPPNKHHLQSYAGLPVRDDVLLIGVVSRLVYQKGFDMALPALRALLSDTEVQLVLLGTGERDIEYGFWRLGQDFHWKAQALLHYDAAVAQQIYAGCDLFLMPSHFEPCGTGQMAAMRYGALPLVRATGGLADTVENYDNGAAERGTGFVFEWETPEAVLGTLRWAVETWHNRPDAWKRMQRRAMQVDFSWNKSAQEYVAMYEQALARHK